MLTEQRAALQTIHDADLNGLSFYYLMIADLRHS